MRATTGHPEVYEIISDFSHIFYTKGFLNGDCNVGECTIPTGNTRPTRQKAYRTPLANRYIIEKQIAEMLDAGIIVKMTNFLIVIYIILVVHFK